MTTEYRQITDDVCTVSGFLTDAECAAWVAEGDATGWSTAPITTVAGPLLNPNVRNNARAMIEDPGHAATLFERIRPWLPATDAEREGWTPVGCNERFRLYRYDPGQAFDWHYDGHFARGSGERSFLTFMIYLSEGFEGGATEFADAGAVIPTRGTALLFVHPILHRGAPVTAGRKYALRTDVMYRPPAA